MHIVIFCGDKSLISQVADELILGICDSVNAKTSCRKTVIKIEEKDIQIEIRLGDAYSAAGLRPDYVLFYNTTNAFRERWNYIMKGRYRELHSLDELTKLVLMTDKKENNFTQLGVDYWFGDLNRVKNIFYNRRWIFMEQERIGKALIELVHLEILLADGKHNEDIENLVKIENDLMFRLSQENRIKFLAWKADKLLAQA